MNSLAALQSVLLLRKVAQEQRSDVQAMMRAARIARGLGPNDPLPRDLIMQLANDYSQSQGVAPRSDPYASPHQMATTQPLPASWHAQQRMQQRGDALNSRLAYRVPPRPWDAQGNPYVQSFRSPAEKLTTYVTDRLPFVGRDSGLGLNPRTSEQLSQPIWRSPHPAGSPQDSAWQRNAQRFNQYKQDQAELSQLRQQGYTPRYGQPQQQPARPQPEVSFANVFNQATNKPGTPGSPASTSTALR